MRPFLVLSLPRSRSTWLSEFLSYDGLRCGHDIAALSDSIGDFMRRLSALAGTCETAAVIAWPLIRQLMPQATIVVVRRPVSDIKMSLARFGIVPVEGELEYRQTMLEECARQPGVIVVEFRELDDPEVCRRVFETCTGRPFDREWYSRWHGLNVQVDMRVQMASLAHRQAQIQAFKSEVASALTLIKAEAA